MTENPAMTLWDAAIIRASFLAGGVGPLLKYYNEATDILSNHGFVMHYYFGQNQVPFDEFPYGEL